MAHMYAQRIGGRQTGQTRPMAGNMSPIRSVQTMNNSNTDSFDNHREKVVNSE